MDDSANPEFVTRAEFTKEVRRLENRNALYLIALITALFGAGFYAFCVGSRLDHRRVTYRQDGDLIKLSSKKSVVCTAFGLQGSSKSSDDKVHAFFPKPITLYGSHAEAIPVKSLKWVDFYGDAVEAPAEPWTVIVTYHEPNSLWWAK